MSDRSPKKQSPRPTGAPRREHGENASKQRKEAPARGKAAPPTKPPIKITGLREGKQNNENS